jgi:hypothetical protein
MCLSPFEEKRSGKAPVKGGRESRMKEPYGKGLATRPSLDELISKKAEELRGEEMTVGTIQIDGRKFRVIPEEEYQALRAALRAQQQAAREDARDAAIARRRLNDPNRKSIPLSRLKADLGL